MRKNLSARVSNCQLMSTFDPARACCRRHNSSYSGFFNVFHLILTVVRPPPWQVFQTFNKADHTKLELNKTYIIIHQIQKYSCLIEKSTSTKILLGSPDCFEVLQCCSHIVVSLREISTTIALCVVGVFIDILL